MRVAVIGAGAAGLASARHVTAQGFQCEVYEMAPELGGTWVYTDCVGKDKYGYPVHTAMYKGLRANLPKEIMGFPDFPIPQQNDWFLTQETILNFLNLYADHFNVRELVKFNEMVLEVRPVEDKWEITSIHKATKQKSIKLFDAVMVCNGHYHTPILPNLLGEEKFKGKIIHSHQYRSLDPFKDQKVLVIGAGPSGLDIALHVAPVAKSVVVSHHAKKDFKCEYPANVSWKPDVRQIRNEQEVEFVDDSSSLFDFIVYCTGYKYNFPFLHESCRIRVEDNHVQPLYKHLVNIEKPTMCFIGLPYYVCAFQMFDLQARFYCQYLNKSMALPTKEEMLKDLEEDVKKRLAKGCTKKQMHLLGHDQKEYFDSLSSAANITPIPAVICKIWNAADDAAYNDVQNFRKDKYRIVNNEVFVKTR